MRHVTTIFRGAALAALVLSLAAVTAGAAVRRDGHGSDDNKGTGNGNGTTAVSPAASGGTTLPGQANAGGQATPPGQATAPGQATPPGGSGTPGQATAPGQATPAGQVSNPASPTPPGQSARTQTDPLPIPRAVAPVVGRSMGVKPLAGDVKVRLPQSSGYVALSAAGSVPSGAIVDARAGTIVLRTAVDAAGHTQAAQIRGAIFEVRQPKDGKGMTDLILRGGRPQGCPATGSAAMARAAVAPTAKSKPRPSSLWARDDHGRFRSRGRNSAATVRGTEWITTETCAGTVTKVVKGAVDVFDRHTKRTVRVRAGHSYLARDAN
jgi:hypothetical protein